MHYAKKCCQQAPLPSTSIGYDCDWVSRVKINYPLLAARQVQAPNPTTLRVTNGCQGRDEALKFMGRSFKITAEKARAMPKVVTGMYSIYYFVKLFPVLIGTLLVNYFATHVVFDLGVTRSFVS